jgi:hypothetical protein
MDHPIFRAQGIFLQQDSVCAFRHWRASENAHSFALSQEAFKSVTGCALSNETKAIWLCEIFGSERIAIHRGYINRRLGAAGGQSAGEQAPLGILKGDRFL